MYVLPRPGGQQEYQRGGWRFHSVYANLLPREELTDAIKNDRYLRIYESLPSDLDPKKTVKAYLNPRGTGTNPEEMRRKFIEDREREEAEGVKEPEAKNTPAQQKLLDEREAARKSGARSVAESEAAGGDPGTQRHPLEPDEEAEEFADPDAEGETEYDVSDDDQSEAAEIEEDSDPLLEEEAAPTGRGGRKRR